MWFFYFELKINREFSFVIIIPVVQWKFAFLHMFGYFFLKMTLFHCFKSFLYQFHSESYKQIFFVGFLSVRWFSYYTLKVIIYLALDEYCTLRVVNNRINLSLTVYNEIHVFIAYTLISSTHCVNDISVDFSIGT